jgi:iron complex outermembrane receptor protein
MPTVQWNVPNPVFPGGSNSFFASARGHELPHTPTWTTNVGLNYVLDTALGNWSLDANFLHSSGWYGEPDNQLAQAAYNSINAGVYLHPKNQPFSIGLGPEFVGSARLYCGVGKRAHESVPIRPSPDLRHQIFR